MSKGRVAGFRLLSARKGDVPATGTDVVVPFDFIPKHPGLMNRGDVDTKKDTGCHLCVLCGERNGSTADGHAPIREAKPRARDS